jgi:hypothetical protein
MPLVYPFSPLPSTTYMWDPHVRVILNIHSLPFPLHDSTKLSGGGQASVSRWTPAGELCPREGGEQRRSAPSEIRPRGGPSGVGRWVVAGSWRAPPLGDKRRQLRCGGHCASSANGGTLRAALTTSAYQGASGGALESAAAGSGRWWPTGESRPQGRAAVAWPVTSCSPAWELIAGARGWRWPLHMGPTCKWRKGGKRRDKLGAF